MHRRLEPELMEDDAQVRAYAEADFEEPNGRFVDLFDRRFGGAHLGYMLDLGCGPGDIVRRFAEKYPEAHIHGVDGSPAMLDYARRRLPAKLRGRVTFIQGRLPHEVLPRSRYDAVVSNSLLHHLAAPGVLWDTIRRYAPSGAAVLVMDLRRPASEADAAALVATYAGSEPTILRRDFYNSLLAAFEPAEVEAQLASAGLSGLTVESEGDRHLVVAGRL